MKLKDLLGKEVIHNQGWESRHYKRGIVVSVDEEDLPLIGVIFTGNINSRKIPYMDLSVILPSEPRGIKITGIFT